MGLFDFIFKKAPKPRGTYEKFKLLTGYEPRFTSYSGSVYESELVRSAINARATQISKLRVEAQGAAKPGLQAKLRHAPNAFQTWSQFLYRLSTILDVNNTAFIVPIWDEFGQITGVYAPLPERCEIVQYSGTPYLRYEFQWGQHAAVEMDFCGVMTKYQYKHDFFGESNAALDSTMDLIEIQNQGIKEGVKNSATYRFVAQLSNFATAEDLAQERQRFTEKNLMRDANGGGLLLFPNTYSNIQQVQAKPFVADPAQMELIKSNVFEYFGVNDDVIQNRSFGDAWAAFYEGAVEPFAIQFSEVMTKMLFTLREQSQGSRIIATANRLQYMSNADKLNVSAQMADRGLMTRNEIREIWNMSPLPEPYGSQLPIRGEYYNVEDKTDEEGNENS